LGRIKTAPTLDNVRQVYRLSIGGE
jgi:hypothetical protein